MASLRDRKYARTRLALVSALKAALEKQAFADVPVKALCHSVEVSEATFFNYFASKSALLEYAIQFWLLELAASLAQRETQTGLRGIEQIFAFFAAQCKNHPGFMSAFMVWLTTGAALSAKMTPSELEKQLAWPEREALHTLAQPALDKLLVQQLEQAIQKNQLPHNVLMPTLLSGLIAILLGIPLVLLTSDPDRIASMYQQQLQIFWSGIRSTTGGGNSLP